MVGYTELVNRLLDRRMVLDKSEGPRAKYEILGRKEKNARLITTTESGKHTQLLHHVKSFTCARS